MRRFQKLVLSVVVVLLVLGMGLLALAPHSPGAPKAVATQAELESYLNRLVASGSPPGLSVVVVKDGRVAYSRAFGLADGPRNMPATPATVYHWWSLTKIPTAIAILQLQERGLLRLDDAVARHLPWFEVRYPSADRPAITLRHLLQHSSGLPDVVPAIFGWTHTDDAGRNQTELVRRFLPRYHTLTSVPGARAAYSNLNYMVLGAVVEAVSGQSYESYIAEHVLAPLGMSQTAFVYSPAMAAHEAAGSLPVVHFYTLLLPFLKHTEALLRERQGKLYWFNRVYIDVTPSTGLIGSAPDVGRLMLAYLNQGTLEGVSILRPESVALMSEMPPVDRAFGLGWYAGRGMADARYLEHTGGGPGFASLMRLYPARRLGVAVLANGTDLDYRGLANLLAGMAW